MINTIFYYPTSLTFEQYQNRLSDPGEDGISNRTIVFAHDQKAIYKGGVKYGGWSTQEFHDAIDSLYDDSWIKDEIDGVKSDIVEANGRINGLNTLVATINATLNRQIESLDDDIKNKVQQLFANAQWFRDHFPQGEVSWQQGWNENIEAYLRSVGYWDTDNQGNDVTKWSNIQQQVDAIYVTVNSLVTNGTLSQALTSAIEALVQDGIASLNLGNTYARIEDVNGVKTVIEWLYSGLKSQTNSQTNETFTEILSSGKDAFASAISDVKTYIKKVKDGDYVAQTEVSAKVNDTIATLITQASGSNALATLSAKANANSDNISALLLGMTGSNSTADIQTRVANAMSGFISSADLNSAKSEIYSAISAKDNNDNFISLAALKTAVDQNTASISAITQNSGNTSGFVAKSELGGAVAELFASNGDATAKASVVTLIKDNKSQLNLTASDVNVQGYLSGGSASFTGDVNATSFTTGTSSQSGISVMSGNFDSSNANTNKAYFAYDSDQGAVTLWIYHNSEWQKLDLSKLISSGGGSIPVESWTTVTSLYTTSSENITSIGNNFTAATLYYNNVTAKYYSQQSTDYPVTGTYYRFRSDSSYQLTDYDKTTTPGAANFVKIPGASYFSDQKPSGYVTKVTITDGTSADGASAMECFVVSSASSDFSSVTVSRHFVKEENTTASTTGIEKQIYFNGRIYSQRDFVESSYTATTLADALVSQTPSGYSTYSSGPSEDRYISTATVTYNI